MEEIEAEQQEEEFLNLSLAIVDTDSGSGRKRKRKVRAVFDPLNSSHEGCEGKIFKLLQMREQMLKPDQKKKGVVEDGKGLHLIHLLLITATAVDENNVATALENLSELYTSVCLTGDSVQRVVAYFADGLSARLLTRKSPFYEMIMKEPTSEEEFLAFTHLYRVSPYYQFAHFTANQAILEAFEKEEEEESDSKSRILHVIDFDVSYGFQWPSLIQSLSEKASSSNRISLRITGLGRSLEELQETESRLVSFAKGFRNLVFDFQGLLRGSKIISNPRIRKKNETVAVNLVSHLNTLNDFLKIPDTLKSIHSLNPSIVILVEQEGSRSPRSFLSRFMESLHYFAAMYDSLDDCLPLESSERLSIEKNHLGKEIKSMLNYDKDDLNCATRYEKMETWKGRMENHGFSGMKLSSKSLIQAKLLLKIRTHHSPPQFNGENSSGSGFRVFERDEGKTISLGWQDRCLLTASAWRCV
ncbi:DELLA protein GAI1, putative [Ricinus communis]|uniref:DELLA protein GAI1, putative n=1 Tax=Ricinus communis TaxID=3988 RepID=B9SLH8_RICCO|nr:DELLA protein GAI1, putative [Ricinus communis]|eukprot:XP_002526847.1 scarecrow-like protein 23 [Ricinus communis]